MPDCLSLGGDPSSTTKLYSSLPNLVHGTILFSEGSRSFRGASGLWPFAGRVLTTTAITVIAATICHQESHLFNNPPTVISNRDNISGQHQCYRTVLLRPTPSSPNPPWLQGPSSWSAVQTTPASVDAGSGVRAVMSPGATL